MRAIGLAVATCIGLAAGFGFVHAPSHATRWNEQYRSTALEIPRGTVELASFGTVDLAPDGGTPVRAMHVRIIVSNTADDRPWTVDASEARLVFGDVRIATTFANSDADTLPFAIVERGERAVIDCYFALPDDREPTAFDVAWTLRTPDSARPERTRFSVDETPSPRAGVTLPAGWGTRWWFDRSYPWPSFYHQSGILVHRPPTEVVVSRRPARHEATTRRN